MKILRALSVLLDYPTELTVAAQTELAAIIGVGDLAATELHALRAFIAQRCNGDLLDWQAEYDGLFGCGRALSLLLFEHVHGESRDRGQAMVDLLARYRAAGLDIDINELPDYIPLYLEFLSTRSEPEARRGLQEIAHILALLACRLDERHSDYAPIFYALLQLSGVDIDLTDLRQQLAGERRDDTPEALDKVWEEEAVTFAAPDAGACDPHLRPLPGQRRDQVQQLNLA